MTRRLLAALVAAFAFTTAPAMAAEGDPILDSCLKGSAAAGCTVDEFVDGPFPSALSADGKRLFVGIIGNGSTRGNGIQQFSVSSTGALSRASGPAGCLTDNGSPSVAGDPNTNRCQLVTNLGALNGLLVVGNNLYATTLSGGGGAGAALLTFDNAASGTLTKKPDADGCIRNGGAAGGCAPGRALGDAGPMAVNADASALYVRTTNGIATFTRDGNGKLTQKGATQGCIEESGIGGCANGVGLSTNGATVRQMTVSGNKLYTPHAGFGVRDVCPPNGCVQFDFNGGLAALNIEPDGSLTQAAGPAGGCISNDGESGAGNDIECVNGHDNLVYGRAAVAIGDDVYLTSGFGTLGVSGNTIFHFRRTAEGLLGQHSGCYGVGAGCTATAAVTDITWIAPVPDGSELIMAASGDAGLGFMLRNTGTGALTQRPNPKDCMTQTGHSGACETNPNLGGPITVAVAPDGLAFFVTNHATDSVLSFDRDFAPTCQGKTADAAFNTSVAITLSCSDPNGDPLTLEITQQPTNGTLAAIDQANGTVRYSPALGFSGSDAFKFRALSRGGTVSSAPADVGVTVAAPPTDNDKDGISPPTDCDDNNAAVRPGAAEVPGNGVDEDCAGGDQALPPGRVASGVDFFFDARNLRFTKVGRLEVTSIPAGATVQVRCIGGKRKGCRFKSKKRSFTKATAKFSAKRYFNFTKRVRGRKRKIVSRLKKGTKIEIRVTTPTMIGKVVTFTTRRGKTPTFVVTCLPIGATKPQKTC